MKILGLQLGKQPQATSMTHIFAAFAARRAAAFDSFYRGV